MVLILTQNGTKLQLQLALLVDSTVAHRDLLALVEFRFAYHGYALLEIENAFVEHSKPNLARRHQVSKYGLKG